MREDELQQFFALLDAAWELKGQKILSLSAKKLWARALTHYSFETVRAALAAHLGDRERGSFLPMPADLLGQIEEADGRPGAEEAWATALASANEDTSVVWTEETARAYGVCLPILRASTAVSARLAFIEAYCRFVTEARRTYKPVVWRVSEGRDVEQRRKAIADGVRRQLLLAEDYPLLPAPRGPVALLAGPALVTAPAAAKTALQALRTWLVSPREDSQSLDARAKAETARLKVQTQRRVDDAEGKTS